MKIYTRSKSEADFIEVISNINRYSKDKPFLLIEDLEKLKLISGMDVFHIISSHCQVVEYFGKETYLLSLEDSFTRDRKGKDKKRRIDHILKSINLSITGAMVTTRHFIGDDAFNITAVKGALEKSKEGFNAAERIKLDQLGEETPLIKEAIDQVLLIKEFSHNNLNPVPAVDSFDEEVTFPIDIDSIGPFPEKTSNYSILDWSRLVALYCMLDRNRSKSYVEKMVGKNISAEMMIGIGASIYGKKGPMISKEEFASIFEILKDPNSLKIYRNFQNYVNTVFDACMRAGKSIATPTIDKSDLIKEYKEAIESSRRVILMNSEMDKVNVITKQRNVI